MDGAWTLIGQRRSGNAFGVGKSDAKAKKAQLRTDLLAWNATTFAAPGFVMTREKAADVLSAVKPEDCLWRPALPANSQVETMAMTGNAVVFAGRIKGAKDGNAGPGFLVALALADGKKVAELALASPPTYDGIAVAGGRIFVSLQDGTICCFGK